MKVAAAFEETALKANVQDVPLFDSEEEAYEFCRQAYEKSGGVTPRLREMYDFYVRNIGNRGGLTGGSIRSENK